MQSGLSGDHSLPQAGARRRPRGLTPPGGTVLVEGRWLRDARAPSSPCAALWPTLRTGDPKHRWGSWRSSRSCLRPSPSSRTGRTSFYEEYGVIGDVLQNHLTEILTLVAMELPLNLSSSEAVLGHKLQAFRALRGLQRGSAVVGQYQAYRGQVRRELQKPDSFHSLTPTFAGGLWGWARAAGRPHPYPPDGSTGPNLDALQVGLEGT